MNESEKEPTKEQKIWQVVAAIPQGKVASYGQVAAMAGLVRQARFVVRALGKLPAGHSIPWHRVIRSNGQIAFPEGTETCQLQTGKLRLEGVDAYRGRLKTIDFLWQP